MPERDKGVEMRVGVRVGVGFPGVFYPSTRQPCVIAGTYKNFTRQITRQKASGDPSGIRQTQFAPPRPKLGRLKNSNGRNYARNQLCGRHVETGIEGRAARVGDANVASFARLKTLDF